MSIKQNHERYFRVHEGEPYYFYINSDEIISDIKWIEENGIENIKLSQYSSYSSNSLEAISNIKVSIKRLSIFIKNATLDELPLFKDLEELSIGEPADNINFKGLSKLKKLYLVYTQNLSGFSNLHSLEEIVILNANKSFFSNDNFDNLKQLKTFSVYSSQLPEKLDFLNSFKLKSIEFHNIRTPFSIKHLSKLKDTLEILKIGKCPNIENVEETLPLLASLKWLELIDAVKLNDTSFIDTMPKLRVLLVLGKSFFKNGNLYSLKYLDHVSIDNKRHYNLKQEELPKLSVE